MKDLTPMFMIHGSSAGDTITGQAGNDTLIGGNGDDVINGTSSSTTKSRRWRDGDVVCANGEWRMAA